MDLKADPEVKEFLMEDRLNVWNDLTTNYEYDIIRGVYRVSQANSTIIDESSGVEGKKGFMSLLTLFFLIIYQNF